MNPKAKPSKTNVDKNRIRLLALVHIALKDLGIDDDLYRLILQEEFGVESSKNLTNRELTRLVDRFAASGFRSRPRVTSASHAQCEALRERIGQELLRTDLDAVRYRRLTLKMCGTEDVKWCRDVTRLKRLAAVLRSIANRGTGEPENRGAGN